MAATTWALSPTAAATRFTDPERTSPMANTPARLVSSSWRPSPQSCPVRTKLSLSQIPSAWREATNPAMKAGARLHQPDHLGAPRSVPIENLARGGDAGPAPAAQCAASRRTETANVQHMRSADLRVALPESTRHSRCTRDRSARNYHPLAPRRFSGLLAMEVPTATWPGEGAERNPAADPRHEPRQSSMGRSPHPQRAPQARHRCRSDLS